MTVRVLVLGAGATGGVFGARLLEAGAEVAFVVRPARAEPLLRRGLTVAFPEGVFQRRVEVRTIAEIDARYDVILLSCKAYDLESAVEAIGNGVGGETIVLPLLNGVAHFELLDCAFGRERVAGGTCHLSCTLEPDGTVRQLSPGARIAVGPRLGVPSSRATVLTSLAALFAQTPIQSKYCANVMQEIWEKFAFIATLASATCLMRAAVGDIVRTRAGSRLVSDLFDTYCATACAAGYPVRREPYEDYLRTLTDPSSRLTSSMLRDLEGGKRTEAEHIVGDMLRRTLEAGQAAQLLEAAYVHLLAHEARIAREHPG